MKFELSQQIFEKLKYQISWKSVQWEPSCSMQTDNQDEDNSRISQIFEGALKIIKRSVLTVRIYRIHQTGSSVDVARQTYLPLLFF
jgi:S-adenosylmethionine/arginine decarboxylase-like enzyme